MPGETFDGREMVMVHSMLRREFGLLPGVVRRVADGDEERATVVAEHIDMLNAVLHEHHSSEDEYVWPLLVERDPDTVTRYVGLMESQHENVAMFVDEVTQAVKVWRSGAASADGATLADALRRLVVALREHLAAEEQHVVPLMEQHIGIAEWNEIIRRGAASGGIDPSRLPLVLGLMTYEGDPEIVEMTIGNMPPEIRPVIGELAASAFAAHAEKIHGTPTPPRSTEL